MTKKIGLLLTLAFIGSLAMAQRVNLSGEWKLNEQESTLGREYSLAPAALSIEHRRKFIEIKRVNVWKGQDLVTDHRFTLDGEPCENPGYEGSVTQSTAKLMKESKEVQIITRGKAEGLDYTLTQMLSRRAGKLVIKTRATSELGEWQETFVYDKQ